MSSIFQLHQKLEWRIVPIALVILYQYFTKASLPVPLLQFPRTASPDLVVLFKLFSTPSMGISPIHLIRLIVHSLVVEIKNTTTNINVSVELCISRASNDKYTKKVWIFFSQMRLIYQKIVFNKA